MSIWRSGEFVGALLFLFCQQVYCPLFIFCLFAGAELLNLREIHSKGFICTSITDLNYLSNENQTKCINFADGINRVINLAL